MPYGRAPARSIANPIYEPLWGGHRVLADLAADRVELRDERGDPLEGHELLRAAIVEAAQTADAVLDGYLLPAPLRDTTGAESVMGLDSVMSPQEMSRQFLLGGGLGASRREALDAALTRRVPLPSHAPTALVAVDLLWLDGESLLDVPLAERKRLLDAVVLDGEVVRRTVAVRPPVEAWYGQWHALGFREIAVKAANSRYVPGEPNPDWTTFLIPKR